MLDWLYDASPAAEKDVPIDPSLTEAGTSNLAPFDPFLGSGRTRRKASRGVTDAIKAELYDSDDLEYANYDRAQGGQSQGGRETTVSRLGGRTAKEGSLEALTAEAYGSDEHEYPGEIGQPHVADRAGVGEDPLPSNNASTSGSRTLRSPEQRKKTFKSVEGAAQSPRKRGEGARKTSQTPKERWTAAEHDALLRATDLVTLPKSAVVWLGFEEVRRPQLLAEYIRRRTGSIKTSSQITRRLGKLAKTPALKNGAHDAQMSLKDAHETDWHARLGPDRFPQTKPVSLLEAYGTVTAKKPSVGAVSVTSADADRVKRPRLSSPDGTSTPLSGSVPTSSSAFANGGAPAPDHETPLDADELVDADPAATPPSPDDSFEAPAPLHDEQEPKRRVRVKKPKSRPFVIDLSAILSSLVPGRDLTTAAHALFACGITSTFYLADLLVFDKDVANVFLDIVGKRMDVSAFELAWAKKALETARNRIAVAE